MEIRPGIIADQTALFLVQSRILVLSDLHLGYEEELRRKGVFIPTGEFARAEKLLEELIRKYKPATVILNGDVKHGFGSINDSEWRHTRKLLEALQRVAKVVLVRGNHDLALGPVARAAGLATEPYWIEDGILFLHGDAVPEPDLLDGIHTLIMGHEHPAVALTNGIRSETYKCFLLLPYEGRTLIVLPSTFSLTAGLDILANPSHNPLLSELVNATVYAVEEDVVMACGTVAQLRAAMPKPQK